MARMCGRCGKREALEDRPSSMCRVCLIAVLRMAPGAEALEEIRLRAEEEKARRAGKRIANDPKKG